jgi:hypothetical protein
MTVSHPRSHDFHSPQPSGAHLREQPWSYALNPAVTAAPLTLPVPAALIASLPPRKTPVSFALICRQEPPILALKAPIRR